MTKNGVRGNDKKGRWRKNGACGIHKNNFRILISSFVVIGFPPGARGNDKKTDTRV
ncbi:MAG: hypothetical protein IPM96_18100 [Ignavibacteria bacterium]|nr:hypothetical protein [Ignavibacteria bacterium]